MLMGSFSFFPAVNKLLYNQAGYSARMMSLRSGLLSLKVKLQVSIDIRQATNVNRARGIFSARQAACRCQEVALNADVPATVLERRVPVWLRVDQPAVNVLDAGEEDGRAVE